MAACRFSSQTAALGLGAVLLLVIWAGPLPELAQHAFAAHMLMHVCVVAVAAPLIAWGLSGSRINPALRAPRFLRPALAAIPVSILELVIVWGWHSPYLHHLARSQGWALALEQTLFFSISLLVWIAAIGGMPERRYRQAGAGVAALLLTSMHMTLLGALLTLAPRPLYPHGDMALWGLTALEDQQLGGTIMLIGAGGAYLLGGLLLLWQLLKQRGVKQEQIA